MTIKAIKNTIGTSDALPQVPNKWVEKVERLSCFCREVDVGWRGWKCCRKKVNLPVSVCRTGKRVALRSVWTECPTKALRSITGFPP